MTESKKETWWQEVRAVFTKDVRSELRTKSAVAAILIFSLTTMVLVSFTVNTYGLGFTQGLRPDAVEAIARGEPIVYSVETMKRAMLLSSLFWIILFFSAMAGLPRVFVKEEEMRTAAALRLAARPSAVYAGKLAFNLALMEIVALLLLPLFVVLLQPRLENWPLLIAEVVVGSAAIAGTATLLGAIASRANNRAYLMSILGFGPLLPILGLAIEGTAAVMQGTSGNKLMALVSYMVVMVIVSGLLFDSVWRD